MWSVVHKISITLNLIWREKTDLSFILYLVSFQLQFTIQAYLCVIFLSHFFFLLNVKINHSIAVLIWKLLNFNFARAEKHNQFCVFILFCFSAKIRFAREKWFIRCRKMAGGKLSKQIVVIKTRSFVVIRERQIVKADSLQSILIIIAVMPFSISVDCETLLLSKGANRHYFTFHYTKIYPSAAALQSVWMLNEEIEKWKITDIFKTIRLSYL